MADVFISYAHEDRVNDTVLEFSNRLRTEFGIDSEIDQYEEAPAEGWPKWMTRQVQSAKYVLVLSTELYSQRAEDYSSGDVGAGVKWETSLILQELYGCVNQNTKYIPIILDATDAQYIPLPLKPYTYYDISNEETVRKLAARLKGESISKRPALGTASDNDENVIVPLDAKERKSLFFSTLIDVDLWNKAGWKGVLYAVDLSYETPPKLALWFTDYKYGTKIFEGWRKVLGKTDEREEMRISFVEHIDSSNPFAYRVSIGSNPLVVTEKMKAAGIDPKDNLQLLLSRNHTMEPENLSNLHRFKEAVKHCRSFILTLAIVNPSSVGSSSLQAKLDPRFEITKHEVFFRTKEEVERDKNDFDQSVL